MPMVILVGVDGSFPYWASHFQNQTSGTVKTIMKNGLMELEIMPETSQAVLSLAQKVRVEPFWLYTIQNTMAITKITIKAVIRSLFGTDSIAGNGCASFVPAFAAT